MFWVKIRIDNIIHRGLYIAHEPSYDNMRLKKYWQFPWAISINFILTQQLPQVQTAAQAQDPLKVVPVARSSEPWHTCVGDLDKGVTGLLTTADQPVTAVGSNPKGDFETGLLRRACARHGKSHFD